MAIGPYLAMTAAEIHSARQLPAKLGWMACHFSPYHTGLTNLPQNLPPGSLLILNDRIPPMNNEPKQVYMELAQVLEAQKCKALLLDFQCPENKKTADMAAALTKLPFSVAVSQAYAAGLTCPVFLPPAPVERPLQEYLAPYGGREIWLELALDAVEITVTRDGSHRSPVQASSGAMVHHCSERFCRYHIAVSKDKAVFTLQRTKEDLTDLLSQAEKLGVTQAVGLWQELK